MKVQLQSNALRLRVDEEELARLFAGETLGMRADLRGRPLFAFELRFGDAFGFAAGDVWHCVLPTAALRVYADSLPRREALAFHPEVADTASLRIDFEVDVRDSRRRRGPASRDPAPA